MPFAIPQPREFLKPKEGTAITDGGLLQVYEGNVVDDQHEMDAAELAEREEQIERTERAGYFVIGHELAAIHNAKLYRHRYQTFENYCDSRWELTRQRAYQLMDAARFVSTIVDIPIPARETHVRPLLSLDSHDDRLEVWRDVLNHANGDPRRVRATNVADAVTRFLAREAELSKLSNGHFSECHEQPAPEPHQYDQPPAAEPGLDGQISISDAADNASDLLPPPPLDLDETDRRDIRFLVQAIRSKFAERPPHKHEAFYWALFDELAIELDDLLPIEAQP